MKRINAAFNDLPAAPEEAYGTVWLTPKTWQRPFPLRKKNGSWTLKAKAQTRRYEQAARRALKDVMWEEGRCRPMDGRLRLEMEFATRRPPKGHPLRDEEYMNVKPDIDNMARSFMESMDFKLVTSDDVRLGVMAERAECLSLSMSKRWADRGELPNTTFLVTRDGADGSVFSDGMVDLIDPSPRPARLRREKGAIPNGIDWIGEAPDEYGLYVPIAPVPWMPQRVVHGNVFHPKEMREWQDAMRLRIMRSYWSGGERRPMAGHLLLECEFLVDPREKRERWMQWMLLLDYVKNLMDSFAFKRKSYDGVSLGLIEDDSRVCAVQAVLRDAASFERPGVRFLVRRIDPKSEDDVQAVFRHLATGYYL